MQKDWTLWMWDTNVSMLSADPSSVQASFFFSKDLKIIKMGDGLFSSRACSNRQGVMILDWKK